MHRFVVFAIVGGLFFAAACDGGPDANLRSERRDTPTREWDVIPPDVDTDWPLGGDDTGDTGDTDDRG